ncbi:MAG: DNA replication regulator sld2 [Piccolia ochrophora]|nr:MAG: DNA replication regulator sld2 [Piccolia ochrophora]
MAVSAIPIEESRALDEKSRVLRSELKDWEKSFAAQNDGRKAGRDDIKQNPSIAAKYKEYNKLRDILSGKLPVQKITTPSKSRSRKRKAAHDIDAPHAKTPRHNQPTATPSKPSHPADLDPYDSPSLIRTLFTPSHRTTIGPTPQKDGHALGLFDALSADDGHDEDTPPAITPSRRPSLKASSTLHATPQRPSPGPTLRHTRTPTSSGKRFFLDHFMTPLKRRRTEGEAAITPSSSHEDSFATPSFLRRDGNRPPIPKPSTETTNPDTDTSPVVIRMPPRPPARGLSAILAGLRKMEDDALEDEMDVLREMENERAGPSSVPNQPDAPETSENPPSNKPEPQARKAWKKKGQKRTTRRFILRPTQPTTKPSSTSIPNGPTSLSPPPSPSNPTNPPTSPTTKPSNPPTSTTTAETTTSKSKQKPRKPTQDANFRRLKLRSKGGGKSGGGGGGGGRGRRRR